MLGAIIAVILFLIFGAGILRLVGQFFITAVVFAFKLICIFFGVLAALIYMVLRQLVPFVAKHLAVAVPWAISALVAFGLTVYAFGRHIFHGENAIVFLEKLIPQRENSRRTEFSLLLIELTDSIHADILSRLEVQIELIREFFRPLNDGE
ncbi:MAG: hypothetical protein J5809_09255 [Selenomonadaceae bacterium]|nr:hypothetical protein [Selenomonadaceae bacterium]